ncbi:MAG: hypothetical protein N3A61_07770, partial [Ignavibacteria bacterium]|nr:hypothetical protein [Ignavibacteria bacterium]
MKEFKLILLITLFSTQVFPLSDTAKSSSDSLTIFKSQNNLSYFIKEIKIIGNEITEDEIILREMSIKEGMEIKDEDLQFNENRIMSLGLFSEVKLRLTPLEDKHQLIIYVKEAWYIWPIPILEINDKDWNKLSFGLGISIMNFRGKNETLFFAGAVGYDPWVIMSYKNPWFERNLNLQMYVEFLYQKRRNKSLLSLDKDVNFDQKIIQPKFIIGKRFG